jgi:thioredoxin-like negative regulator of GroEL
VAPEIERLAALMGNQALIVKVNTEEVPEVATLHRIQSIPTFVVFRGGLEVSRTSGAMSASRLREFIVQAAE